MYSGLDTQRQVYHWKAHFGMDDYSRKLDPSATCRLQISCKVCVTCQWVSSNQQLCCLCNLKKRPCKLCKLSFRDYIWDLAIVFFLLNLNDPLSIGCFNLDFIYLQQHNCEIIKLRVISLRKQKICEQLILVIILSLIIGGWWCKIKEYKDTLFNVYIQNK